MAAGDESAPQPNPGDYVVAGLFALLLLLPSTLGLAGYAGADTSITTLELRAPFVAPPVTTGALANGGWQRDAERQIADDFPLRHAMIESFDVAKYVAFGDIASPLVTRGRDGWLFFADTERRYDDGTYDPSDADLARVAGVYAARAAWCASRGATFVLVLVPNKSSVYPQYLPRHFRHVTPSPAERLVTRLRSRGVHAVDLRAALVRASAAGDVYSKGDTHWNDDGAYAAYRELVRELTLHDSIAPASITRTRDVQAGDLDRLAGITAVVTDRVVRLDFPHRAADAGLPSYPDDPAANTRMRAARTVNDPRLPNVVMFGDSFLPQLAAFLAEDFHRSVLVQGDEVHGIVRPIVAAEKPALVIEEIVERKLVDSALFEP